jgi:hypothetical protein
MMLVVAIAAITTVLYYHLKINRGNQIKSILAWIHVIETNVGSTTLTVAVLFAGLIGSEILEYFQLEE